MKFKKIRTGFMFKVLSIYLALNILFPQSVIYTSYALTSGPSQPEFSSFTPIGTSDMVNLSSGDFTYNIPLMDVGGYPLNLAYNSGVTTDQEASWVGLGWDLSVGQINRSVRGIPDDFKGDNMKYENNLRANKTYGVNFGLKPSFFGFGENDAFKLNLNVSLEYNTHSGFSMRPTASLSYAISKKNSVGLNISSSATDGVSIAPSYNFAKGQKKNDDLIKGGSAGFSYNSRKGLGLNLAVETEALKYDETDDRNANYSASYSFNNFRLFTPTKRVGMRSENISFNASTGGSFFGIDGLGKIGGFYSEQKIADSEKNKTVRAYGYENNEKALGKKEVILDFNREKERAYSQYTKMLAQTNFTYDIYSVKGQGIGGSFRPHKGQVSYVYDTKVSDSGMGESLGIELEVGNAVSGGGDFKTSPSISISGAWETNNFAKPYFNKRNNTPNYYEPNYYKMMSEINVDDENYLSNYLQNQNQTKIHPIALELSGSKYNRSIENNYMQYSASNINTGFFNNSYSFHSVPITNHLSRNHRMPRNTVIYKVNKLEAENDNFIEVPTHALPHHTVGYKILKTDGSLYVYGKALYNTIKKEVSFAVSGNGDNKTGLVSYSPGSDNSPGNKKGIDNYFNRVTTPAYAHTYLLTSILSADYQDIDEIAGPSDGDLGSYTKFIYAQPYNYKWRTPFKENTGSSNPGFYSHPDDQKASYVYGEREQTYISRIETKTHIAVFYLSKRKDALGVKDENGGKVNSNLSNMSESYSMKLDSISLFAKEDFFENGSENAVPIKTVHLEYDYSLSSKIPNSLTSSTGKLTLKKVWFTYKNSKMGKYTPYEFSYGKYIDETTGNQEVINPEYGLKSHDIWGNYKKNETTANWSKNSPPSNIEFPYVNQENRAEADKNAHAWTLTEIELPSGGKIEVSFEADDYQYVQNKKAMRFFEVLGAGKDYNYNNIHSYLYKGTEEETVLFLKVPKKDDGTSYSKEDFVEGVENDPIYFKFLLNMGDGSSNKYDYVTGYFYLDDFDDIITGNDYDILPVKMKTVNKQGGIFTSNRQVNPISKAGWYFGRNNMNKIVYSHTHEPSSDDIKSVIWEMVNSITSLTELISGPNGRLRSNGIAKYFIPQKSWVRLIEPSKKKIGGGSRVKQVVLYDNWDKMMNQPGNDLYLKKYGQKYSYEDENGYSSGVATFEPAVSKENPFVKPYFDRAGKGADKLLAPRDQNYFEGPIGESFFPSPTITYSRVTVSNLFEDDPDMSEYQAHGTGKVVNEFYTSKDFPTLTNFTPIQQKYDSNESFATNFLNLSVKNHLSMSQGFTITKNDMNGKQKSQKIFDVNGNLISGVDYQYSIDDQGNLLNELPVIDEKGHITKATIGVEYDVVNDFKEIYNWSATIGIDVNVQTFILFIPIVTPVPIPDAAKYENKLNVATTTVVVQKHGILKKKIAYDLGAVVSTENMAWDKYTGDVLITRTDNEFGDDYYSINYPARWLDAYRSMRQAMTNLGMQGLLTYHDNGGDSYFTYQDNNDPDSWNNGYKYLIPGDVLIMNYKKYWVLDVQNDRNNTLKITLIDKNGKSPEDCEESPITNGASYSFKIVQSGYRNYVSANMASITTTLNPLTDIPGQLPDFANYSPESYKIINASAISYLDFWPTPAEERNIYLSNNIVEQILEDNENDVTKLEKTVNEANFVSIIKNNKFNPYRYNIRGNWRAIMSYAYLTDRNISHDNTNISPDPRKDGYFGSFSPFYKLVSDSWVVDRTNWTKASTVTRYSPYGFELENQDALKRYSSAQYGYDNTLPTAVASNTQYREIGFDGFEDHKGVSEQMIYGVNFVPLLSNSNPLINVNGLPGGFPLGTKKIYNNHHFNFEDAIYDNNNASISDKQSHTGNYSVLVNPNSSLSLTKKLTDCQPAINEPCEIVKVDTISIYVAEDKISEVMAYTTITDIDPCTKKVQINFEPVSGIYFWQLSINELTWDSNYTVPAISYLYQTYRPSANANSFRINTPLIFFMAYPTTLSFFVRKNPSGNNNSGSGGISLRINGALYINHNHSDTINLSIDTPNCPSN